MALEQRWNHAPLQQKERKEKTIPSTQTKEYGTHHRAEKKKKNLLILFLVSNQTERNPQFPVNTSLSLSLFFLLIEFVFEGHVIKLRCILFLGPRGGKSKSSEGVVV